LANKILKLFSHKEKKAAEELGDEYCTYTVQGLGLVVASAEPCQGASRRHWIHFVEGLLANWELG
jgi:hypothetical protein